MPGGWPLGMKMITKVQESDLKRTRVAITGAFHQFHVQTLVRFLTDHGASVVGTKSFAQFNLFITGDFQPQPGDRDPRVHVYSKKGRYAQEQFLKGNPIPVVSANVLWRDLIRRTDVPHPDRPQVLVKHRLNSWTKCETIALTGKLVYIVGRPGVMSIEEMKRLVTEDGGPWSVRSATMSELSWSAAMGAMM